MMCKSSCASSIAVAVPVATVVVTVVVGVGVVVQYVTLVCVMIDGDGDSCVGGGDSCVMWLQLRCKNKRQTATTHNN